MRNYLLLFVIGLVVLGCGGYKGKTNPMSPEEVKIADMAQQLETKAIEIQKASGLHFQEIFKEFTARASRFHNTCRRFGSSSLEARSAFDRLYYQASQVSASLDPQKEPQLNIQWERIKTDSLLPIAQLLGYKPEE